MLNRTCTQNDCDEPHYSRGLCRLHFYRARETGAEISYQTMHTTVHQARGEARLHKCTDCGRPVLAG